MLGTGERTRSAELGAGARGVRGSSGERSQNVSTARVSVREARSVGWRGAVRRARVGAWGSGRRRLTTLPVGSAPSASKMVKNRFWLKAHVHASSSRATKRLFHLSSIKFHSHTSCRGSDHSAQTSADGLADVCGGMCCARTAAPCREKLSRREHKTRDRETRVDHARSQSSRTHLTSARPSLGNVTSLPSAPLTLRQSFHTRALTVHSRPPQHDPAQHVPSRPDISHAGCEAHPL